MNPTESDHTDAYRRAAKALHEAEGEIEFDTDAVVSLGDNGAYVQAWIWVDKDALTHD